MRMTASATAAGTPWVSASRTITGRRAERFLKELDPTALSRIATAERGSGSGGSGREVSTWSGSGCHGSKSGLARAGVLKVSGTTATYANGRKLNIAKLRLGSADDSAFRESVDGLFMLRASAAECP